MKIRKVLFAVKEDTDPSLFKRAYDLTREYGASLDILYVAEEVPDLVEKMFLNRFSVDLKGSVIGKMEQELEKKCRKVKAKAAIHVVFGVPDMEIIRFVSKKKYDMVIIGRAGLRSKTWPVWLGTTEIKLMRKCPSPIFAIGDHFRNKGPVMAAVDHKHGNKTVNGLNQDILESALEIAAKEKRQLIVLQGWRHFGEEFQKGHWGLRPAEAAQVKEEYRKQNEKNLAKLLEPYRSRLKKAKVALVEGDPETVIRKMVAKEKVTTIVMGTVCRTGISGFLMGNTAEKIMREASCSILALKPRGFKSPVKK